MKKESVKVWVWTANFPITKCRGVATAVSAVSIIQGPRAMEGPQLIKTSQFFFSEISLVIVTVIDRFVVLAALIRQRTYVVGFGDNLPDIDSGRPLTQ